MSGWIALALYVAGFLFTYRRAYLALMRNEENGPYGDLVDTEGRVLHAIMAMLAAMLWPVTIFGFLLWRFATPVTPGQRKSELDARERRVAELERELGIERGGR